jgi:hypothetical protein
VRHSRWAPKRALHEFVEDSLSHIPTLCGLLCELVPTQYLYGNMGQHTCSDSSGRVWHTLGVLVCCVVLLKLSRLKMEPHGVFKEVTKQCTNKDYYQSSMAASLGCVSARAPPSRPRPQIREVETYDSYAENEESGGEQTSSRVTPLTLPACQSS